MEILKNTIYSNGNSNPSSINKKKIEEIYKKYGLVILRDFNFDENDFFKFADQFTKTFSNDANRRKKTDKKQINHVDVGIKKMSLHSEASFAPTWPEIIWFYGKNVSKKYGETTICCGNELWEGLSSNTKNFLKSNLLKFRVKSDIGIKIKNKKWNLNKIGVFNEYLDKNGYLNYEHIKFAITNSKYNNKIYLSSHILYEDTDPTIISMRLANNKEIPKKIINEIKKKSDSITYYHQWKKRDVLMIDNKRYMHGRNKIIKKELREILNIQTLISNI